MKMMILFFNYRLFVNDVRFGGKCDFMYLRSELFLTKP